MNNIGTLTEKKQEKARLPRASAKTRRHVLQGWDQLLGIDYF
jgi:hypothetical protein